MKKKSFHSQLFILLYDALVQHVELPVLYLHLWLHPHHNHGLVFWFFSGSSRSHPVSLTTSLEKETEKGGGGWGEMERDCEGKNLFSLRIWTLNLFNLLPRKTVEHLGRDWSNSGHMHILFHSFLQFLYIFWLFSDGEKERRRERESRRGRAGWGRWRGRGALWVKNGMKEWM